MQIRNYKSFLDSGSVNLSPGVTVVVGQNNAGKSAFIEALSFQISGRAHRSDITAPNAESQIAAAPSTTHVFQLTHAELNDWLADTARQIHHPMEGFPLGKENEALMVLLGTLLDRDPIEIEITHENHRPVLFRLNGTQITIPSNATQFATFVLDFERGKQLPKLAGTGNSSGSSFFSTTVGETLRNRVYMFQAQRPIRGRGKIDPSIVLSSDGSNLAGCLHSLKNMNPAKWERFTRLVRQVFPDVQQITTRILTPDTVQIEIWGHDPRSERDDLAVSLDESGTGLGQAMAIIYVAATSVSPQTILIDEPQSFLHPSAIRDLLDVLKRETPQQHQYILTTHSPNVISDADPDTLLRVHKSGFTSEIDVIDRGQQQQLRNLLAEVGARPSDVFGMNEILWVEGPTEEQCLPLVLEACDIKLSPGTAILGVVNTGDLEGKRGELIIEIYGRLSGQPALMPPSIGFLLDRELRTDEERTEMQKLRSAHGKLHFLPRRMYENYLVNAAAIASVVSSTLEDAGSGAPVTTETVQAWIDANKWETAYIRNPAAKDDARWNLEADATKFLHDLISAVSGAAISYKDYKVEYGRLLTEWILTNSPADFEELCSFLREEVLACEATHD